MGINTSKPPLAIATVTILNAGMAQTVVTGLSLKTVVDGRTYIGIPLTIPETIKVSFPSNVVTYHGGDSLVQKLSSPIVSGGEVNDVCIFMFKDATPELLSRPNRYSLIFTDVFGRLYEIYTETTTTVTVPNIDLPGVHQDIIPAPAPQ